MSIKKIWVHLLSLEEVNRRSKNTLSDHLNIDFVDVGDRHLTARMPVESRTHQPMGIMHGGASAALAETVASAAANYCVDQKEKVCVGLELNINHLRPVQSGFIEAIAEPLHLGRTTQVWDIKIHDSQQRLVSVARLTLAVIEKRIEQRKEGPLS
ncbi:MAG: hotdog fold thioesterase [Verrucomicrobiota bacterium]|nr:hotdog fold thioesterase [Verrucomicrobiota bacterium]